MPSTLEDGALRLDATSDRRLLAGAWLLAVGVVALGGVDLATDLRAGTSPAHAALEGLLVLVGLAAAAVTSRKLARSIAEGRRARAEAADLTARLRSQEEEAARWREEARAALEGLSAAIDRQLDRWGLSPAEKEVALLLLKGLSHKEIAVVRSIAETTARQQARAVYRKAGLEGRSELAAFFLEDLLLPERRAPTAP